MRLRFSSFARPKASSPATPRRSACRASPRPDESRPFPIVIVRTDANDYFGYVNTCPHEGTWLNFGTGEFFSRDRAFLRCGRHGATFEIDTGLCVDGPCRGESLEPIALAVIDGEVCLCGVALVEDDGCPDPFVDEADDTMEIMIHPD